MPESEALTLLDEIVHGIDQEDSVDGGWWETSAGANFGAAKLVQLQDLVRSLTKGN